MKQKFKRIISAIFILFALFVGMAASGQTTPKNEPVNFIFTSCTDDVFTAKIDANNMLTIQITADDPAPEGVQYWDRILIRYSFSLSPEDTTKDKKFPGINFYRDHGRGQIVILGQTQVTKGDAARKNFTYQVRLTPEQVAFIKQVGAFPDKKGVSFGSVTYTSLY